MAGIQGFEPQFSDPESDVLPLDDIPKPSQLCSASLAKHENNTMVMRKLQALNVVLKEMFLMNTGTGHIPYF